MKKFLIFLTIVMGIICSGNLGEFLTNETHAVDGEVLESSSEFFIKAVNPGYTVDGVQNVGEMIEIGRKNSDDVISLAGLTIGYTNSSGNTVALADFSRYIWKAGETILLRLASSPGSELANAQYTKTLAFKAGPLTLNLDGEVIDSVCWTGKDGCFEAFNSSRPTTLVRDVNTGNFGHISNYEPNFGDKNLELVEENDDKNSENSEVPRCKGVEFSEILSYYEILQSEQFVELHNMNAEAVVLDGCNIRYKNKYYSLNGMIQADGYLVREAFDFKLTKNPTTSNMVELLDADGTILDKLTYPNGQRKGASYALIGHDDKGEEIWRTTYAPTPGGPNNFQEFRTCEEGKVINEATGNCVKVTSIAEKICGEGQYLNILTGRCKKISTTSETKCKDGYYLNEETGRCRKIQENTGADFALVPETYAEKSSFVALYLVLGAVGVGVVYIGYEFRHEIGRIFRRMKWW